MPVVVGWSSIYLQLSSLNFMCSGLFSDILCLRWFLSWAYLWLFINAVCGFPDLTELYRNPKNSVFILHYDVLAWSVCTFYVHFTKLMGIVMNERKVHLPEEYQPLWRVLYRNGGLSELLFKQFIMTKFDVVTFKKGTELPLDGYLYIILDGTCDSKITLQRSEESLAGKSSTSFSKSLNRSLISETMSRCRLKLTSGDILNVKYLHMFRAGSESEAFANQSIEATAETDMTLYRIRDSDILSLAKTGQTKNAYQGLLIFALTAVAEREIIDRHFADANGRGGATNDDGASTHRELGEDGRDVAFQPLREWEEPNPLLSGSGGAFRMPLHHFGAALKNSFKPPPPLLKWIPGLRHSMLPAPHLCPPAETLMSKKDEVSSLTQEANGDDKVPTEKTSLV